MKVKVCRSYDTDWSYRPLLEDTIYERKMRIHFKSDANDRYNWRGFTFEWKCVTPESIEKEVCSADVVNSGVETAISDVFAMEKLSFTRLAWGGQQRRMNEKANNRQR